MKCLYKNDELNDIITFHDNNTFSLYLLNKHGTWYYDKNNLKLLLDNIRYVLYYNYNNSYININDNISICFNDDNLQHYFNNKPYNRLHSISPNKYFVSFFSNC